MSATSPSREQTFSRLFHATAEAYWQAGQKRAGLMDAEGKAFLASIGYSARDFFDFIDDYVGVGGEFVTWHRKAAEQGSVKAQSGLGYLYANGIGVEQDYAEAAIWYGKAARQGAAGAQSGLGYLYANGLGVARDDAEAINWYGKAAEQGDRDAECGLGYLYANGFGAERDLARAAGFYRRAAEKGSDYAQLHLGLQYLHGHGVEGNREQAIAWLRKAAVQGNAQAREELIKLGIVVAESCDGREDAELVAGAGDVAQARGGDEGGLASPIFIVGCGHSGTSLLVRVLGAHSRICAIPFESNFALKWPEPCEDSRRFFAHAGKYARAMGKARWLEKTPRHIFRIGEILRYFPEAKIVLMLRDGRDVACSIRDRYGSLEAGINRWVEDNQAGRPFWTHPSVRVVRYEELVAEFEKTVRGVMEFIGEEFQEALLRYHETAQYFFTSRIEKPRSIFGENHELYRNWQINQPLFDGRGKWRQMTEEEKRLVKAKAGQLLIELGYAEGLDW